MKIMEHSYELLKIMSKELQPTMCEGNLFQSLIDSSGKESKFIRVYIGY